MAASALTSDHPCQYKLLDGLKGFIEEADVRFFIATQGDSEIQLDQAARMNWRSNALREQLERYSVEEKQQILENLEGEFGTRLHSVLDFAAAQTSIRSEDALLISMTSK